MARKEHSNSLASRLQPEEFEQLREWLSVANMSYADAVEKCEAEFGVSTSVGALTNFFQKHCVGFKHKRARDLAASARAQLEADPDCDFNELTLKKIEQLAFEQAFAKDADVDELKSLASILGDSEKLKLQHRRLELDVNKFRAAVKTDIEKGLDALLDEIKGNAAAMALFDQMKAIVMQSVEVAEA